MYYVCSKIVLALYEQNNTGDTKCLLYLVYMSYKTTCFYIAVETKMRFFADQNL